jgi:competence protein ComEC
MNELESKLYAIDRELAGPKPICLLIRQAPLCLPVLGLVLGILVQTRMPHTYTAWMILTICLAVGSMATFCVPSIKDNWRLAALIALASTACFLLGSLRLAVHQRLGPRDISHYVDERLLATVTGRITSVPQRSRNDWVFAQSHHQEPGTRFSLALSCIKTGQGWAKVDGTVQVFVAEEVSNVAYGESVLIYCWLRRIQPATNPGQFDSAAYLAKRNIFVSASVTSSLGIEPHDSPTMPVAFMLISRMRRSALNTLTQHIPLDQSVNGFLQALILGHRQDVDSQVQLAFKQTGLLHLISLSGMHMGILVSLVWWLARCAGLLKPARAMVCTVIVAVFLLLVPPRAPTLRAAILCWSFCTATMLRRTAHPLNCLSLAAMILLMIRPTQVYEAGWQLSFACVLGILLLSPNIQATLNRWSAPIRITRYTGITWCVNRLCALLSVGLGAWLGGLGILVFHFHVINLFSVLWTLLCLPWVSMILVLGFLKLVLSTMLPATGLVLGPCLYALAKILMGLVALLARVPLCTWVLGSMPLWLIVTYYALLLLLLLGLPHKRRICLAILIGLLLGALRVHHVQASPKALILTCQDVGHGQALVVQVPGHGTCLFDAGSLYQGNIGERIVVPFLHAKGIDTVESLFISHNDSDHLNGIPEIITQCTVRALWVSPPFLKQASGEGPARVLRDFLRDNPLTLQELPASLSLGKAELAVLWPPPTWPAHIEQSDNNQSTVALMTCFGRRILVCSDIEQRVQAELLQRYPNLRADIVIAPHHGSRKTLHPQFLEQVNAQIVLCSCARSQYDMNKVIAPDASISYTARDGAVIIRIDPSGDLTQSSWLRH